MQAGARCGSATPDGRLAEAQQAMTPREARAIAKVMFRELAKIPPRVSGGDNLEFFERAAVLADVVLQSDRPDIGEMLALALRRYLDSDRPSEATWEIANAITRANATMFPPRQAPCMPNRADLRRLVIDAHGESREAREWLRRLWREMEVSCGGGRSMAVFDTANSAIRGHGVGSMTYYGDDEELVTFEYVSTGDLYNETVGTIYEPGRRRQRRRFLVTTEGDVREQTERRFLDRGVWRRW